MELKNKVVFITGGAGSIGQALTDDLLSQGYQVVIADVASEELEALPNHKNSHKLICDVSNETSVQYAVNEVINRFRRIDILINNAGIIHSEPLLDITSKNFRHSVENWDKVISINLRGPFLVTSYISELMIKLRTKGVIINISSICAKGNIGQTAYSASKAGLEAMTSVWAKELSRFGIRCVAVAPGFINTKSTQAALSPAALKNITDKVLIRKLGDVSNVIQTIKFCIENDYLNDTVLSVNGGLTL